MCCGRCQNQHQEEPEISTLALWMPATDEAVVLIEPSQLGVNCIIAYFWLLVLMLCDKGAEDASANDPCRW